MRKPLMIDLCCGRGGWTKGFIAAGWRCIGYDIKDQPDYPGTFSRRDLLNLNVWDLVQADFICVSTPCEKFAVFRMRHFHPSPAFPADGIALFEHAHAICVASGKPFIMENVYAAQQFVGLSIQHCGPFHFWGNAVPAIFPAALYSLRKNMNLISGAKARQAAAEGWDKKQWREARKSRNESSHRRKARVSLIPFDLAFYVGTIARENLPFPVTRRAAKPAIETATA